MAIQTVVKGLGGTIETQFLDRHPSSCTVTLYTNQGAAKVSAATCTVDALSTTLSAAVAAGDTSVDLASAVSCVVGRRYLIGDAANAFLAETVTVRSLSASTATIVAPLLGAHPMGATVKGVRASYVVAASACDAPWINGFADFNPNDGSDIQTEAVECYLRKIPEKACDETDLRMIFPAADKALDVELDIPLAIKDARDMFLLDLGGKNRAHVFIGTDFFRKAVARKFWLMRRFAFGSDWKDAMDALAEEYKALIMDLQQQLAADNDQDGTTGGLDDGGTIVATLERS